MLKVTIEDLTFNCILGILPAERKQQQKIIINLSFEYFYNEDGSDFIDYSEVSTLLQDIMIEKKFLLIEDAILYIRKKLKSQYDMKNIKLKISKPDILSNCVVSVEE
jgi:dihydroneopterin aldolase